MSSHVDLINQRVQTPGDFIQEENLKRARIAGREYIDLTNKINQKSLITWGRVSSFFQTVSLVALVFTMVAPFFMNVPSWSFGVMVGGSLVIGIPLSIKQGKEEEIKKNRLNFLNFLSVFQEMNKQGNTSLHLACEGDLPSQDPRLQCERDPVFRGISTKDVRRVVDKYGLVDSPGAKFLVSHRFAKTENSMYQDIERGFEKFQEKLANPLIFFSIENDLTNLAPHYERGIINTIEGFGEHLTYIASKLMEADENRSQALYLKLDKLIDKFCLKFDHSTSAPLMVFNQLIKSAVDNLKAEILKCRGNGTDLDIDAVVTEQIKPLCDLFKIMEPFLDEEYLERRVKSEEAFFLQQVAYMAELDQKWVKPNTPEQPDLAQRFRTLKELNRTVFQAIKLKEESIPAKVLEKCKKEAEFLRNLINDHHIYSFLTELTAIDKQLDDIEKDTKLDLGQLKAIGNALDQLRLSRVQLRINNFSKDSFFKRELEPYFEPPKKLNKWEKLEFKAIDAALSHYDKQIVSKITSVGLIWLAVSVAYIVMYSLLKMDPWMNLMCELGALALMFGMPYAHAHIHRLRKEVRVLKMRQYFIEHPEMMNRLPPLPQVKEKLAQLKKIDFLALDAPPFSSYEQISRVLVDL